MDKIKINTITIPFFSVVIPLYNKENYILKTLKSVCEQTFTNFEIIVINDGSTDASLKKVRSFFLNNDVIDFKIISRENRGLSATRNQAIELCSSRYIAFLDADDIWDINYLAEQYKVIKKFPTYKVFGTNYFQVYAKETCLQPKINLSKHLKNQSFIVSDFFKANLFQNIINLSCTIIDIKTFKSYPFNTTIDYSEDLDFFLRVFTEHKLAYLYKPLAYKYENVSDQITQSGVGEKRIPDFKWYEQNLTMTDSLKKFINRCRFMFASLYKQTNNNTKLNEILTDLDFEMLSWKQWLLLKLPNRLSRAIINYKKILLKKGIRITTFSE